VNRSQLLELLVRLAAALTEDFSVQDVVDRLAEELSTVVPVTGVGVLLADAEGERHVVSHARELEHAGDAVRTVRSVPLRRASERFRALEVYATASPETSRSESDNWQKLADVVASYLSIAHRRETEATSVARLQEAALHDPLTGLPNRRLLQDRLHLAQERMRRSGAAYGVLFCDLDGFKPINDQFGHQAGDQLLVELARRLERVVRPHDTVARVSGDEFVLLCEDLEGPQPAKDVADRVLTAVEAPFPRWGDEHRIRVGISVGIAVASHGAPEGSQEILDRADAAMYRAKRRGGRCAEVAAPAVIDVRDVARARTFYSTAS
jgi:diguanylate cyclase (GGDEF)-like protein